MVGHLVAGQILFWRGEFIAARAEQEGALSLYDPAEQRTRTLSLQIDPGVNARMHLGWTLWSLGFPDQGVAAVERALADARRSGQPFSLAMALFWRAAVAHCCGDWETVRAATEELRLVTAEHHITYLGACATVLESSVCIESGQIAAGIARLRRAFGEFRDQQAGLGWPWGLSHAVAGCALANRREEGLTLLGEAFAAMERNGERHWEAELHRLRSELLPRGPAAEDAAWRAVAIARAQSARSLELRAVTSLARQMIRRGAAQEARRLAAPVLEGFTEGFGSADVIAARRLVRELADTSIN
jgi:adenylate cyclase